MKSFNSLTVTILLLGLAFAGQAADDKKMQAEGKFEKTKGAAHKMAGDVKDKAREAAEKATDD